MKPSSKSGNRTLKLSASAIACAWVALSTQAPAQTAAQSAAAESEAPSDAIIVTGTRRSDVTAAESPTPVDIISSEQITRQGFTDVNDLLRAVVPSLNSKTFPTSSYAVAIRPFSLRGLSPDQSLVLVNGKRRHRSAIVQLSRLPLSSGSQGPDLSMIPGLALDRAEVLRDGAAAQYGSDAIAGVINFQLKRNRTGGSIEAKYGQYYQGDGKTYDVQGNIGLPLPNEGFVNISGQYAHTAHTDRSNQPALAATLRAAGNTAIPEKAQPLGEPKTETALIFVNAELPISDTVTTYLFGNYGDRKIESIQSYRAPSATARADIFSSVPLTTTPGGPRFSFLSLFPGGILPKHRYHITDQSLTMGLKGDLSDALTFDLSGALARSRAGFEVVDTINPSLGPTAPTRYNPGSQVQREQQLHADFNYAWDTGIFAKPLNVAFGAEYRREEFSLRAGDPASYTAGPFASITDPDTGRIFGLAIGASAFPGFTPGQAGTWSRSNKAFYIDLETDVIEGLTLGTAARYEHFSDFGGTFNYKATGRYEVTDWFAMRGSYNTGFRAPTVGQSHISSRNTGLNPDGSLNLIATFPVDTAAAQYFGATTLKPEKSKNFSIGGVLNLGSDLLLTADYFNVKIKNRIGVTSNIAVTAADRIALAGLGVTDASGLNSAAYFTNAFDTTTQGFDVVASKHFRMGEWSFDLSGSVNYTKTDLDRIRVPIAVDRERRNEINSFYPKWRGTLSGTVGYDRWSALGRLNYYGKYADYVNAVSATSFDQFFGASMIVDVEVRYEVTDDINLAAGANNLFGKYPGKEKLIGLRNAGFIYTQNSPYGSNGGFWYVRASAKF